MNQEDILQEFDPLTPPKYTTYEATGQYYNMRQHLKQQNDFTDDDDRRLKDLVFSTGSQNMLKKDWQVISYLANVKVQHLEAEIAELKGENANLKAINDHYQEAYARVYDNFLNLEKYYKSLAKNDSAGAYPNDKNPFAEKMSEETKLKLEKLSQAEIGPFSWETKIIGNLDDTVHIHNEFLPVQKVIDLATLAVTSPNQLNPNMLSANNPWPVQYKFRENVTLVLSLNELVTPLLKWIADVKKETGILLPTSLPVPTGDKPTGVFDMWPVDVLAQYSSPPHWRENPEMPTFYQVRTNKGEWISYDETEIAYKLLTYFELINETKNSWELSDCTKAAKAKEYAEKNKLFEPEYATVCHGVTWNPIKHTCKKLYEKLGAPASVSGQDPFDGIEKVKNVPLQNLDFSSQVYNLPFVLDSVPTLTESNYEKYRKLYTATQTEDLEVKQWKELTFYFGQLTQCHYLRSCMFSEAFEESQQTIQKYRTAEEALQGTVRDLYHKVNDLTESYETLKEHNESKQVNIPTLEGVVETVEQLTAEPYKKEEYVDLLEVSKEYLRDQRLREYENPRNSRIEKVVRHRIYLDVGMMRIIAHYQKTTLYGDETVLYCQEVLDTLRHYYEAWKQVNDFWFNALEAAHCSSDHWALNEAFKMMQLESVQFTNKLENWMKTVQKSMQTQTLPNIADEDLNELDCTFQGIRITEEAEYTLPKIPAIHKPCDPGPAIKTEPEETFASVPSVHPGPVFHGTQYSTNPSGQYTNCYPNSLIPIDPVQAQRNQQAALATSNVLGQPSINPSVNASFDAMSDATMKPQAAKLMRQHDDAKRPYQKWKRGLMTNHEKLTNNMEPLKANFFWSTVGEAIEFTDLTWFQKIMKLTESVSDELKTAIASQPTSASENMEPCQKEKFDKRQYFIIKAMLKERNNFNPMVNLQVSIDALPMIDEKSNVGLVEEFMNVVTQISSLVPMDMPIPHSTYYTKLITRFERGYFNRFQNFLETSQNLQTLQAVQLFFEREHRVLKEYQQTRIGTHRSKSSKPQKVTSYATTTEPTEKKWCPLPRHADVTNHWLKDCVPFNRMDLEEKKEALKDVKNYCWKCTRPFHGSCDVHVKKCGKCKIAHLEILPCPAKRSSNRTQRRSRPRQNQNHGHNHHRLKKRRIVDPSLKLNRITVPSQMSLPIHRSLSHVFWKTRKQDNYSRQFSTRTTVEVTPLYIDHWPKKLDWKAKKKMCK